MIKKIFSLVISVACSAASLLWGQSLFYSPNQQIVEAAVKGGICIAEQNYQLEDTATNQRFGRYGNDNFGRLRTLAVRADSILIVDKSILLPWEGDDNFARYRESHRPVLSTASIIELSDTTMVGSGLSLDSVSTICSRLLAARENTNTEGFRTNSYQKAVEGWLVVVAGDTSLDKWDGKAPSLRIFRKLVEFDSTSEAFDLELPQINNKVWGGVFLVPEQTAVGQLTFMLGGIICQGTEDGHWQLVPPAPNQLNKATVTDEELTPLKHKPNKHKKKK